MGQVSLRSFRRSYSAVDLNKGCVILIDAVRALVFGADSRLTS